MGSYIFKFRFDNFFCFVVHECSICGESTALRNRFVYFHWRMIQHILKAYHWGQQLMFSKRKFFEVKQREFWKGNFVVSIDLSSRNIVLFFFFLPSNPPSLLPLYDGSLTCSWPVVPQCNWRSSCARVCSWMTSSVC